MNSFFPISFCRYHRSDGHWRDNELNDRDRGVHRERDDGGCSCLIHNDASATSDYLVAVPVIKNGFKGSPIWRPSLMHFEEGDGPEVIPAKISSHNDHPHLG